MELKCSFKNFKGEEIRCNFIPLTRKEYIEVFYKTGAAVIKSLQDGFLLSGVENKSEMELGVAILSNISNVDFELVWSLAKKLFKFAIINGTEIKDLDTTDYFTGRPEEFFYALFCAIKENFPGVFFMLKAGISGSDQ